MKNWIGRFVLGALSLLAGSSAFSADSYPSKPIRVIVPYAAGGVVDVQTRVVTQRVAIELGQPIVVEAKPGAGGNIAAETVARAPADGYTVLVTAPFIINNPLMETGLRWAPRDFMPVVRFTLSPSYFVVPMSSPARTVKEYVELAKKASPPLQYGDGGPGSTQSMANEMFKIVAGIPLEPVLYKGAPPIVPDLIKWHVFHGHPALNRGLSASQGGQAALTGQHQQSAFSATSRRSDHRRGGLSGRHRFVLVWVSCAGWHAVRCNQETRSGREGRYQHR